MVFLLAIRSSITQKCFAPRFGSEVDYATVVTQYDAEPIGEGRYSPPSVSAVEKTPIVGEPVAELVSTSTLRFTRLTNAFSKRLENHVAAVALYVAHGITS